jgi:hypothetical protein
MEKILRGILGIFPDHPNVYPLSFKVRIKSDIHHGAHKLVK